MINREKELAESLADRYTILREIGHGGMATVYLARDLRHERDVAVKVLHEDLGSALGVDRFLAEIRVTANLQHPNILPLFDSGEVNGLLFYVMPFVAGETLRTRLQREKQLPIEEAIQITSAIAGALAHAHGNGVIHRDLKPENILMQAGQPVIADFGIALALSKAGGERMTQTGLSLGTPQYMSPEQATADRVIDSRSDIYSLGAITYEMRTGDPPHSGNSSQAIIARLMTEEPRPVRASRPSVPEHVEWAVHTALAKLPADRFSTAAEFAVALTGKSTGLTYRTAPATRESPRKLLAVWAAIAIAGVAVGLAIRGIFAPAVSTRVLRVALKLPANQAFVYTQGIPVLFTPDGSAIVYSGKDSTADRPNGHRYYYRRLDQSVGIPLPGTEDACCAALSPSGDWMAFNSTISMGMMAAVSGTRPTEIVRKVSLNGGPAITLDTLPDNQGGLSWGADDRIYVGSVKGLSVIPASGGKARLVSAIDTTRNRWGDYMPLALPDGKHVLVWAQSGKSFVLDRVDLTSSKATTLDGDAQNPIAYANGYLLFSRTDGALGVAAFDPARSNSVRDMIPVLETPFYNQTGGMVASLSAAGDLAYLYQEPYRSVLHFADRQGNTMAESPMARPFGAARVSPDGRLVAVDIHTPRGNHSDIWLYDIASHTLRQLTDGRSGTVEGWSPDGRRVIYRREPLQANAPDEVWFIPVDGSGPTEQLFTTPLFVRGAALSPDGRHLVVTAAVSELDSSSPDYANHLYLVDLRGDRQAKPLVTTSGFDEEPAISPDGRWLAYTSTRSGNAQLYVRPFLHDGPEVAITSDAGGEARWSPDSRSLAYWSNGARIRAQLAAGATISVTRRDTLVAAGNGDFDLLPNGGYVVVRPLKVEPEILMVFNWLAELRTKAKAAR